MNETELQNLLEAKEKEIKKMRKEIDSLAKVIMDFNEEVGKWRNKEEKWQYESKRMRRRFRDIEERAVEQGIELDW